MTCHLWKSKPHKSVTGLCHVVHESNGRLKFPMPTTCSFPSYNPEFNYLNCIEGRIMEYLSLLASERPKRERDREGGKYISTYIQDGRSIIKKIYKNWESIRLLQQLLPWREKLLQNVPSHV